ncbi:MAG TPA: hypothetical protein VM012_14585 [Flavitalea sp.]|nr:hypothetical protein [Flavitalea sp.]
MPRKKTEIDKEILEALKYQIRIKSGLECVSFSQITWLQHDIKKSANEYLSLQTLNRLFLIIKNNFNPSLNTLNVLAQYLRYRSFDEFVQLNSKIDAEKPKATFELRFLLAMFTNVDPYSESELILQDVFDNVFTLLKNDAAGFSGLYPAMAATPFGRKYFFEKFINIDALDKEFGDGLKYYMLYANSREQILFASNLSCYRYFLTSNAKSFFDYYSVIKTYSEAEIMTFNPLVIGQYYAARVFARYFQKNNELLEIDFTPLEPHSRYFERYIVAEALVLTSEFEQAWALLNMNTNQSYSLFPSSDKELVTQFNILWLLSGLYAKKINAHRAIQVFSQLKDKPLKILSECLYSIFILFLKRDLFPKIVKQKDLNAQITHLINKTGFIHFHDCDQLVRKKNNNHLMAINGKKNN